MEPITVTPKKDTSELAFAGVFIVRILAKAGAIPVLSLFCPAHALHVKSPIIFITHVPS